MPSVLARTARCQRMRLSDVLCAPEFTERHLQSLIGELSRPQLCLQTRFYVTDFAETGGKGANDWRERGREKKTVTTERGGGGGGLLLGVGVGAERGKYRLICFLIRAPSQSFHVLTLGRMNSAF